MPFQIPMPGIFNSIDAFGKNAIHSFFDQNNTLPNWFPNIGKVTGYVPSRQLHWSKFKIEDAQTKILLRGTPDDILQLDDDSFHIVDYKTAKATETQDELFPIYLVQLNVYALIALKNGPSPISGLSLIYMEPQTDFDPAKIQSVMSQVGYLLDFKATLKKVELKPEKLIPDLFRQARDLYDSKSAPQGRNACRDCELLGQLIKISTS